MDLFEGSLDVISWDSLFSGRLSDPIIPQTRVLNNTDALAWFLQFELIAFQFTIQQFSLQFNNSVYNSTIQFTIQQFSLQFNNF